MTINYIVVDWCDLVEYLCIRVIYCVIFFIIIYRIRKYKRYNKSTTMHFYWTLIISLATYRWETNRWMRNFSLTRLYMNTYELIATVLHWILKLFERLPSGRTLNNVFTYIIFHINHRYFSISGLWQILIGL